MENPLLSIIIINYNTFELTSKCIYSIIEYESDLDFEIILVDNNSTDHPPNAFLEQFPSITLIKSTENVGFAKGNNLGLARARGQYLLLLNSDTEFKEAGIKRCIDFLMKNPDIGALSCRVEHPDGTVQHVANRFQFICYELIELLRLQKLDRSGKWLMGSFFDHESSTETDWVWGTFFLFPRHILEAFPAKKLPEDYFMYYEDVQWCYKIKKKNYRVFYFADYAITHYLTGPEDFDRFESKLKQIVKNESLFISKNLGSMYLRTLYVLRILKLTTLKIQHRALIIKLYWSMITSNLPSNSTIRFF